MGKLVLKDGFAFVYLNKNFYSKESILNTLKVYQEFFNAKLTEIGKYFTIKIEKINDDYSIETLAREFSNYLIAQEYERKWVIVI